ncbi:MAG: hypothetical protein ACREK8_00900 [Gemmatimonadales bacterium]
MLPTVLAVVLAAAMAGWSWRGRLDSTSGRVAATLRAIGLAALFLLLLDPGIAVHRIGVRPLVLLDNSVSMHAATGHAADAARLAASLGDIASFGELAPGEPGGRSTLRDALDGAAGSGRQVIVVTDGEIGDVAAIPPDLLTRTTVRLLPRNPGADIAIVSVTAPPRLVAGDTLDVDVELARNPGAPDSAAIVVRDSAVILLRGTARFGTANRTRLELRGALSRAIKGEQWLQVARAGTADAEPDDDVRWLRLEVTPTPGVVVVAAVPDWDSRALYRALLDVVEVPVRGYTQLVRGQWRRMDNLGSVSASDVVAAARGADLLAVRGDPAAWRGLGRSHLFWPPSSNTGDWYLAVGGASPVNGAFAGVEPDSLPPAAAAGSGSTSSDPAPDWIGAVARLSRRGTPLPVVTGRQGTSGRSVTIRADGLFRWPFHGGVADQVWRTMIADAATWLLAAPSADSQRARPVNPVTQRGRPVEFRWTGSGPAVPLPIDLMRTNTTRHDTLRFDGDGRAALALAVGRYRYQLAGGGSGSFAVEPYSDELVAAPITLAEHVGVGAGAAPRRSLREMLWLFAVAIAGFGCEWLLRRRMGLR